MATQYGARIHAHHIVQKTMPKLYAVLQDLNVHESWPKSLQKAWYIGKAQDILKQYGVPLLDDIADTAARAANGETLHNLAWAFNGRGVHSVGTAKAVWQALSGAGSKAEIEEILLDLGARFATNGSLF